MAGFGIDEAGAVASKTGTCVRAFFGLADHPITSVWITADACERLICDLARALAEVAPERVDAVRLHGQRGAGRSVAHALGTLAAQEVPDGE